MNENTFVDSLFFRFYLLLSHCFSFLSALCLLSHLEIIRYIMKSMIANSMYFLLKYNWKKKTWKVFFGQPSFGTQTGIAVSQTAWIYQCKHLYFFTNVNFMEALTIVENMGRALRNLVRRILSQYIGRGCMGRAPKKGLVIRTYSWDIKKYLLFLFFWDIFWI